MFTWLNSQAVRSDLGFEVESIDRDSIAYREGGIRLDVEVENGFVGSKPCVIFSRRSFDLADGKSVSTAERDRMVRNFSDAMEFQGLAVVIED